MRRTSNYLLREIAGVPYLIPYGQLIADHKHSMQLNHTSAWLWQQLEEEHTLEELLTLFASHYAAAPEELSFLKQDLTQFLHTLQFYGMLDNHIQNFQMMPEITSEKHPEALLNSPSVPPDTPCFLLNIGGLHVKLIGPQEMLSDCFNAFQGNAETIHQTITIHTILPSLDAEEDFCHSSAKHAFSNAFSSRHPVGKPLLHSRDLTLYDMNRCYLLLFPSMDQVREARLSKDASCADIYCSPSWTETLREELFHAIRFVFLYLAEQHHMTVLHSASLLYRGKAWLFSGSSGTGKSTHTNLWHKLLHVPLLNGDLNLLALDHGQPVIHGLPWCGTSEISDCGTHPLGGIILLKQDKEDYMETLSPDARQLLVFQRLISPLWTPEQVDCCLRFAADLTSKIYVARLHCTVNDSAMETAKKAIDIYLDTPGQSNC